MHEPYELGNILQKLILMGLFLNFDRVNRVTMFSDFNRVSILICFYASCIAVLLLGLFLELH